MPISYGFLIHSSHYMRAAYRYERSLHPSEDGQWPDPHPREADHQVGGFRSQLLGGRREHCLLSAAEPGNGSLEMRTRSGRGEMSVPRRGLSGAWNLRRRGWPMKSGAEMRSRNYVPLRCP